VKLGDRVITGPRGSAKVDGTTAGREMPIRRKSKKKKGETKEKGGRSCGKECLN